MQVVHVREAATRPLQGGARLAGSPAEVARLSEVVLTSLPTPRDVEGLVLGRDGLLDQRGSAISRPDDLRTRSATSP